MDQLTLFGVVVALLAIMGGQYIEGGDIVTLINLPALLIVFGGTVGAVLLQTSFVILKRAFKILWWVVRPPKINYENMIEKIVQWGKIARRDGLLALQDSADEETDPFSKKGLGLLVDGGNANLLRRVMEVEIDSIEMRDHKACYVFESMGAYAPTIGILGAVLGLIQVMHNLAEPEKLGVGIAIAFVATVYGVSLANLFFLPVAKKLKNIVDQQTRYRELILEGLLSIIEGENPRLTEVKLQSFVKP